MKYWLVFANSGCGIELVYIPFSRIATSMAEGGLCSMLIECVLKKLKLTVVHDRATPLLGAG